MIKRVLHIGILAESLGRVTRKFEGFGLTCTEVKEINQIGAKIAFFPVGETMLEFICHTGPHADDDKLSSLVRSQSGTINHICFEVNDLETAIHEFEKNGAKLIEGCPRPGAHGRIAFFYPDTTEGVLVELCEM